MTAESEVIFEERGCAGLITLNRPSALNALTLPMIRDMHSHLTAWAGDRRIERIVIRGSGEKAFCAGGDIRQLRAWGLAGDARAIAFHREEYQLNALIKHYPKPYVALVNGIVMGGGVGVSVHGSHRLCGERTGFAMPECGIGLFPDVGATYFLPRLPGQLGTYLALTGARLGQADIAWCGIATHTIRGDSFDLVVDDLAGGAEIEETCSRHAHLAGEPLLPRLMPAIERCFGADSIAGIISRLRAESGDLAQWAAETLAGLQAKCPISLRIALRQMRDGRTMNFDECMRTEFRIVSRVLKGTDFYEGVRAAIIDKDNRPQWSSKGPEEISDPELARYFAPLGSDELELVSRI